MKSSADPLIQLMSIVASGVKHAAISSHQPRSRV
jgi:hypothetical protein